MLPAFPPLPSSSLPHLFAQVLQLLGAVSGLCRGRQHQLNIGQEGAGPAQVPPQPLLHVEVAVADLGWGQGGVRALLPPRKLLRGPSAPPRGALHII